MSAGSTLPRSAANSASSASLRYSPSSDGASTSALTDQETDAQDALAHEAADCESLAQEAEAQEAEAQEALAQLAWFQDAEAQEASDQEALAQDACGRGPIRPELLGRRRRRASAACSRSCRQAAPASPS